MSIIARTDHSIIGRWWWTVDRWMLGAIALLIAFGGLLIAAASPAVAERIGAPSFHFLQKHLFFLIPSIGIMFGISLLSPRDIRRLAMLALLGGIGLLLMTLLFGVERNGAQRWISLAGFSIQPSEFVKPAFAVAAAWLFAGQHKDDHFPGYMISCGLCALIVALLMMQPDLGMTVVVSLVWAAQFFMAGLPLSIMAALLVLCGVSMVGIYLTFPHVTSRIDRFLDPSTGDNYQVERSIDAFQNGGFFGTGPGQGEVKLILPDAHADFIFAVAGEELGLILTLVLVGIFGFIVIRGMLRIKESNNLFMILAVAGILTQFGGQALIHMGSSVNLLPAKGMTLPFVSYGGSSLLALGFGMGIVLGLTRRNLSGEPQ